MQINVDTGSGFCFGVNRAITLAEEALEQRNEIFCLGEMVHNPVQMQKLTTQGLKVIDANELEQYEGKTVFIRAHGEPPITYKLAEKSGVELVDATCPIVLKLQQRIKEAWEEGKSIEVQIVLFGKPGHAEIIGLNGVINNTAILLESVDDIHKIDPYKPVILFSQTTMDAGLYIELAEAIKEELIKVGNTNFEFNKSICGQVSGRIPQLKEFAKAQDVILFVSGANSANGAYLFNICKQANEKSYMVNSQYDIDFEWFKSCRIVGISGATSTPEWLIKNIAAFVKEHFDA